MNNETDFETVLNVYKRHNVDSFSDLPGNYFWEEFFTACPKAKVLPILTGIIQRHTTNSHTFPDGPSDLWI